MTPLKQVAYVPISTKAFADQTARAFETKIKGKIFQGIVVKTKGRYYAYKNLCQHLPITLDLNDGDFFTHDRKSLQCHMHGALYDLDTGFCTAGPCQGASLVSLSLVEEPNRVVVAVPHALCEKK